MESALGWQAEKFERAGSCGRSHVDFGKAPTSKSSTRSSLIFGVIAYGQSE